jgi:hypothetical protein
MANGRRSRSADARDYRPTVRVVSFVGTVSHPQCRDPRVSQPAVSQPAVSQPAVSQPAVSQPDNIGIRYRADGSLGREEGQRSLAER